MIIHHKILRQIFFVALFFMALSLSCGASFAQPQKAPLQYYMLSPQSIIDTVLQKEGAKVLYLYAASIPLSRQGFPEMLGLATTLGEQQNATFVAVSLDSDTQALDRFLNSYTHIPFLPIVAVAKKRNEMREAFATARINYKGTLPFIVVIDSNNQILLEGDHSAEEVLATFVPKKKVVKRSIYDEDYQSETPEK